ncbi:DUF1648 domain-containing protein [Streptomyces sp. NPDC054837]
MVVPVLIKWVVAVVSWPNLPDPMAVHFDEGRQVNRSRPRWSCCCSAS